MSQEDAIMPDAEDALLAGSDTVSLDGTVRSLSPTLSTASQATVVARSKACDPPPRSAAQVARVRPRMYCALCDKPHPLRHCHRFNKMSLSEKLRNVVMHGYCCRCLSHDHTSRMCPSQRRCLICGKADHNTLLHDGDLPIQHEADGSLRRRPISGKVSRSVNASLQPTTAVRVRSVVLLPTCSFFLYFQGQRITVRALVDSCAQMSRLSLSGIRALGLSNMTGSIDQMVDVVVSSIHRPEVRMVIIARVVQRLTTSTPVADVPTAVHEEFRHFRLADENFGTPGGIQMTLGGDVSPELMRSRILNFPGLPTAQESAFGWILSGPCKL